MTKSSKNQTTVKWKALNPEFREQFVYMISAADLPKQSLYITVWDREKGRQDEYIGESYGSMISKWSGCVVRVLALPSGGSWFEPGHDNL